MQRATIVGIALGAMLNSGAAGLKAGSDATSPAGTPTKLVMAHLSAAIRHFLGQAYRPAAATGGPVITATKTDALLTDVDGDTRADPGDTLRYTVVINNSGDDATGVLFDDTLDVNTTLVPGSVRTTPLARNDSYSASGNIRITVAAPGVLSNDSDPDGVGPALSVTASVFPSTNGGNVALAANGGFTYNPPPGFEGIDTFTYTLNDGEGNTDTGTVNVTVSGMIWFVNAAASCPCDGRLTNPFATLTSAGSFNSVAADDPNDNIFLYSGNYTGGLTLLSGQKLIGQGAGASLSSITGVAPPAGSDPLPATGGTRPTISAAAGNLTLGANNVLRGFNIGNSGSGTGISGTGFTSVTVSEMLVNGTGEAIDLSTGAVNVSLDSVTSSNSAGNGVALNNVSGSFAVTGATTVANATLEGIRISNVSSSTATLQFGSVTINNRNSTGVLLDNVDNSSGTTSFGATSIPNPNNAGGYGIRVQNSTAAVTFASATISGANVVTAQNDGDSNGIPDTDGDGDAIFLTGNGGSFTLNGGTLSNCGNDCIDLRNSAALVLSGVSISSPGLDIPQPVSTGAGFGGHGIAAHNLTGTSSLQGVTISAFNVGNRDGFHLRNGVSTALALTVQGTAFQNSTGNRGFGIQGDGAANMTITVGGPTSGANNCTFANISGNALQSTAGGSTGSTATVNLTVQNSTFQNSSTNGKTNLIAGLVEAGKSQINILNNTFSNVFVTASTGEALIGIGNDGTLPGNQLGLNITGNNINNVGNSTSTCGGGGATPCLGPINTIQVFIDDQGNVPGALVIDNNTLTNVQQGGINLDMANSGANASNVSAKITNNCVGRLRVAGACTGADARVGIGAGLANGRGIGVERRRAGAKQANVLVSGNTVFNGAGQSAGALNTPGIFARTQADTTLSITLTSNLVDTNLIGAPEMRLDTNSPVPGDPVTQVMCSDISANTFPAGAGAIIDINEIVGTHNVEQASAAAVSAANGGATVTADAGVSFGVACAIPPAAASFETMSSGAGPDAEREAAAIASGDVAWVAQAAILRWEELGVPAADVARVRALEFEAVDLPGGQLASSTSTKISVDANGAGHGWFLDPTPLDDDEFEIRILEGEVAAFESSPAHGGIDLLTVLMREIGRRLVAEPGDLDGAEWLLQSSLPTGVRSAPVVKRTARGAEPSRNIAVVSPAIEKTGPNPDPLPGGAGPGKRGRVESFGIRPQGTLSTVSLNIGTLPAVKSITITFDVTINASFLGTQVANQGSIGFDPSMTVLTDDPDTATPNDPTVTPVDQPDVTVAVAPSSVSENGVTNLVYTFTREGSTASTLTVSFSVGGTASFSGSDYTQTGAATFTDASGTVTIGAGNATGVVTIDPVPDPTVEPDETVVLTVASGTGYEVGVPAEATGTIQNDDVGTSFLTLEPCRILDTRDPPGPHGGPALAAGSTRDFQIVDVCGVPPSAKSVAINVTVVNPSEFGHLTLFPTGAGLPLASTINFRAGVVRANNAIILLGTGGRITVFTGIPSGTTHFILDVSGYFE